MYKPLSTSPAQQGLKTWRLNQLAKADIEKVKEVAQEIISKEYANDDDVSREAIIAREITKTTWESFRRFGDKNHSTPTLKRQWIDKDAIPLDTQCIYINNDYGVEIAPEELAQFMIENERGKAYYQPYQDLENLKKLFKEVAGFNWNMKFARDEILPNPLRAVTADNYF